jgi:hypothetical protein
MTLFKNVLMCIIYKVPLWRSCVVMLKQDFCWILESSNSFETLPEFCERPDVDVRVDCLSSRYQIQKSHSVTVPE